MTALLTAPPAPPSALPRSRLDSESRLDRTVRLAAVLVLWSGLLLITYWW